MIDRLTVDFDTLWSFVMKQIPVKIVSFSMTKGDAP